MDPFAVQVELFSNDLTELIIPPSHTGNALVSPCSLLIALTMLLNGTRGNTRESLSSALHVPKNGSETEINTFFQRLLQSNKSKHVGTDLILVFSKLLFEQSYMLDPVSREYRTAAYEYFGDVEAVDFVNNGPDIMKHVNDWVKNETFGYIPKLWNTPPRQDTLVMLINLLFYCSEWRDMSFNKSQDREFHVDGGTRKKVKFMRSRRNFGYLDIPLDGSEEPVQAIKVPLRSFAHMAILYPPPSVSVNELFKQKKVLKMMYQLIRKKSKRDIVLEMPKFKFDAKLSMKSALKSMGAGDLFTRPDLSGISAVPKIKVSDVLHVTSIQVNEWGTHVAGGSHVPVVSQVGTVKDQKPLEIRLDRPFAFVIYVREPEPTDGLAIFVGKVGDPSYPGDSSSE